MTTLTMTYGVPLAAPSWVMTPPSWWRPSRMCAALHGKLVSMRPSTSARELGELLRRVAEGDQAAFAEFYDATSRTVFGIVLSVLRDRAQAEEVAQEVYLEAWTIARQFDANLGSPTGWLNTIAHRRAVDRVRSAERSVKRDQRHFEADLAIADPDTSDIVVAHDEGSRVRAAMQTLPEAQRTALTLAYFEGRSHREVAEYLQLPLGTVKTRIRDAMKRLRNQLGEVSS
jgi:RNA polymerase sigma-70 factor, ECF subfamily